MKRVATLSVARGIGAKARGVVPATASTRVTAVRTFEYWGLWVSVRTQPYCLGDKLPQLNNLTGVAEPSKEAQYLTGNLTNVAYTEEMIRDPTAELQIVSRHNRYYNGHQRYVVSPAAQKDLTATRDAFARLLASPTGASAWFDNVIKLYPNLRTPLDAATRQQFVEFYQAAIDNAMDEAAVNKLAKPFIVNMHEQKFISQTYWWRFAEALCEALEVQTTQKSLHRSFHVVLERVTKVMLNTMGDHPWSHDETSSPYFFDVCGHRAIHEAGYW